MPHNKKDDDDDCCDTHECCETECCDWNCCVCRRRSTVATKTTGAFFCCCFCPEGEGCCTSDNSRTRTTSRNRTNDKITQVSKDKQQESLRLYELRLKLRPILVGWVENHPQEPFPEEIQQMMTRLIVLGKSLLDLNPELSGGKHIIHIMCENNAMHQLESLAKIVGPAWFNLLKESSMHKTGALNFQYKQQAATSTTPSPTPPMLLENNSKNKSQSNFNNNRPPPLSFHNLEYDNNNSNSNNNNNNNNNNRNSNNNNNNNNNSHNATTTATVNPLSGSMMLVVNGYPLSPLSSGKTVLLPQDLATDPAVKAFVAVHHLHHHHNRNHDNLRKNNSSNQVSDVDINEGLLNEAEGDEKQFHQKLCAKCRGSGKEACSACSGFAQHMVEERGSWFTSVFCCSKTRREEFGCQTCGNWGAAQCSACSGSGLFVEEDPKN